MPTINVNISTVKTDCNKIKTIISEQKTILSDYKKNIVALQGNWVGESYKKYEATFTKINPELKKVLDLIESQNATIIELMTKLEAVDKKYATSFNNI